MHEFERLETFELALQIDYETGEISKISSQFIAAYKQVSGKTTFEGTSLFDLIDSTQENKDAIKHSFLPTVLAFKRAHGHEEDILMHSPQCLVTINAKMYDIRIKPQAFNEKAKQIVVHIRDASNDETDNLTGFLRDILLFDEEAERTLARDSRNNEQSAFVTLDMDRFSEVNNQGGHHLGDRVLNDAAIVMDRHKRKYERTYRLGGEEFWRVQTTSPLETLRVFSDLRREMDYFYDAKHILTYEDIKISRSVSIGAVIHTPKNTDKEYYVPSKTISELKVMADTALYNAKRFGRNGICLYIELQDGSARLVSYNYSRDLQHYIVSVLNPIDPDTLLMQVHMDDIRIPTKIWFPEKIGETDFSEDFRIYPPDWYKAIYY